MKINNNHSQKLLTYSPTKIQKMMHLKIKFPSKVENIFHSYSQTLWLSIAISEHLMFKTKTFDTECLILMCKMCMCTPAQVRLISVVMKCLRNYGLRIMNSFQGVRNVRNMWRCDGRGIIAKRWSVVRSFLSCLTANLLQILLNFIDTSL